jgi:ABC-type glycerol-3-phosphate transport system substrate-binding protein
MLTKVSRRHLLKLCAVATAGTLAACAPKVIKETVVVEKQVEVEKVVKETVVVTQEKVVEKEKVVKETVVVDPNAAKQAQMKGKIVWDTFRAGAPWDKDRLDSFKQLWPNVEVELRLGNPADQQANYAKWYAMEAAGDLGDIVQFDPSHFHFWRAADKNILMPIDDLIAAAQTDLNEWYPQFMQMQKYKGAYYGLPSWGWSGYDCLVVNELALKELGVDPMPDPTTYSTTWEQILEWIEKSRIASGDKVDRYGFNWAGGEAGFTVMSRWFGGDLINAEGTKCTFQDDEKALKGLKMVYDLVVTKKLAPAPGAFGQGVSNETACAEGRLTMFHCGSLCAINSSRAVKDNTKAKIGVILFPKREDGKVPSQIRGGGWQVHKTSKAPAIAYEFIKHIAGKDGTLGFNMFGGNTALTRPDVLPLLRVQAPLYKNFEGNLMNGMVINAPANSRGREFTDAITQNGAKVMDAIQPVPFEQGIADMAKEIQKVLDTPPA